MRLIYQKKLEKKGVRFHRVYPVSNSQIPQIPKEKKLFQTDDFFLQNKKNSKIQKKIKKRKNSKIPKESYNKEDC